jgi:hypothetical protein
MPGSIVFKGPGADIDVIERLVAKIGDVPQSGWPVPARAANIRNILNGTSGENERIKTLITNLAACFECGADSESWDLTEYALFFDRSINWLEVEYHCLSVFPTGEWESALKETFPSLSFFIVGEIMTEAAWGVEWKVRIFLIVRSIWQRRKRPYGIGMTVILRN